MFCHVIDEMGVLSVIRKNCWKFFFHYHADTYSSKENETAIFHNVWLKLVSVCRETYKTIAHWPVVAGDDMYIDAMSTVILVGA